jgi:hypothetical protein
MTTVVFRREREADQCPDRPLDAQQGVGELEERVSSSAQARLSRCRAMRLAHPQPRQLQRVFTTLMAEPTLTRT